MDAEGRQALREELLQDLYESNFEGSGNFQMIKYNNLREDREEIERHLAYEYLEEKNLIYYKKRANQLFDAKITSYGIDEIERRMKKEA
jgi:hypothetical protein